MDLIGTASNASAIGAKVRVLAALSEGPTWQLRDISGSTGYGSQNSLTAHFGLAQASRVDLLRIEWPSGIVQEFENLAVNRHLTISEPPILEPVALYPDLGFEMTLTSRGGLSYGVDASTNLKQWTQALAMHEVNGSVQVVDERATRRDYSFYQAVEIPRSGSGLVTWWAGDGNASDEQGNFDGQRQGNVTYLPGVFGRAFNFDGDSTYVETHGQAVSSNVDGWSFDGWVYWRGLTDGQGKRSQMVFAVGLAGDDGYGMTVAERAWCESNPEQCGDVGHLVVFHGGKQYVQPGGAMLPEQEWAHLALTRSSGYLRLYINGTSVFSTQTNDPYPPTGNTHISAGSGYAFNGLIDEARFWNRALSGREVRDIHRVGALELAKRPW